jgi:uncharacterized protein YwgA
MRIESFWWLAAVVAEHDNRRVVGNTRLQKEIWLLQRLGLPTDYSYRVHFYGPYSEDLHAETGFLKSIGVVDVEERQSQERGTNYYVTTVRSPEGLPVNQLPSEVRDAIPVLEKTDPTVLELAATYDAFRDQGDDHDEALRRVMRKKGPKCDGGRLDSALELLEKLGLSE